MWYFLLLTNFISAEFDTFSCEVFERLVTSNAVLKPVLSWIEFILTLSGLLVLFGENGNLLLVERLAIKSFVHSHNFLLLYLQFRLSSFLRRNSVALLLGRLLNIVYWRIEIQIDISFNDANLVIGFAFDDVDQVVHALMVNIDRITLETSRILGQLSLQN